MDIEKKNRQLAKLIDYMLGRNPYEFGLAPDADGFVKMKELIKAVNEEDHFKHIRKAHIDELLITLSEPVVEIRDFLIRAVKRDNLPPVVIPKILPKILYTAVKETAYTSVIENGIRPSTSDRVILANDKELILRIGKRQGRNPVILHVNVDQAEKLGVLFTQCGEAIFLAKTIPKGCFSGPPAGKLKIPVKKTPSHKNAPLPASADPISGESPKENPAFLVQGKKDRDSWKNNKKRIRRQKEKNWPM